MKERSGSLLDTDLDITVAEEQGGCNRGWTWHLKHTFPRAFYRFQYPSSPMSIHIAQSSFFNFCSRFTNMPALYTCLLQIDAPFEVFSHCCVIAICSTLVICHQMRYGRSRNKLMLRLLHCDMISQVKKKRG